jgi:hypothetical protein
MPRMSANASKSWRSGSHGTDLAAPANEASAVIALRARSIARLRLRIALISAAEIRAPPRFARLRSDSANEADSEAGLTSKCQRSRKPSTTLSGSTISEPFRRTTG